MSEELKRIYLTVRFAIRRHFLDLKTRFSRFFEIFYKKSGLEELSFFFRFFFHRYSARQFNPLLSKKNIKTLMKASFGDFIDSNSEGELKILTQKKAQKWFLLKNALLLGAPQSRIKKVLFYSFLTLTLEIYNPFDKKILKAFLERKIALIERLLKKFETINGEKWNQKEILAHVDIYRRSSLLQMKIIQDIHKACRRQKKVPLIEEGQEAMNRGLSPVLVTQGYSGSYWVRGLDRRIIGLFKPFDEEFFGPNDPIGLKFQGALGKRRARIGTRVGEAAHHEVGAFLVDKFFGFGIVPKTYYASFTHPAFYLVHEDPYASRRPAKTKYGSFQEFVEGFTAYTLLTDEEKKKVSLEEFQLLAVLDIIIGNADRNSGNILFADEKIAAVDHGLSFPDLIDNITLWYWYFLKQAEEPLFPSLLDLLQNFPYEELSWKLRKKCLISLPSLHRMRERIALFTEGASTGLPIKKLEGLMKIDYLFPLLDLEETLKDEVKNQVKRYLDKLDQPEEDY